MRVKLLITRLALHETFLNTTQFAKNERFTINTNFQGNPVLTCVCDFYKLLSSQAS